MKKMVTYLLVIILLFSVLGVNSTATEDEEFVPYVTEFIVTTNSITLSNNQNNNRATGLIASYSLSLSKTGTALYIEGLTNCSPDVVKCGFKDLTVQRRKTSNDSWEDYYEYGNVYREATAAGLSTTLVVESGYQYRISCKHYAKKNILSVQTIANTSNIVTVS